ncbi:caspase family protein [Streptomyces cadmiisoli]|uniref:caspase family protein n=1 Tax=Streptomyces cadmiisoli TaxID=2184053 RepID=UPI00365726BA
MLTQKPSHESPRYLHRASEELAFPEAHASRAVLIGVSDYEVLEPLPAVRNNLLALANVFTAEWSWGLPREHCLVVREPSVHADIVDAVATAADASTDTLLVYFAGHGLIDTETGELCLTLTGSRSGAVHTTVPYEWVRRQIRKCRAKRRIAILDCCYGARAFGMMSDAETLIADQAEVEGTYLIASAAEGKTALAEPGEDFTAFTGELLGLISSGLPTEGDLLDLDTVYSWLHSALRSKSRPLPQKRDRNSAGKLALSLNAAKHAGQQWHQIFLEPATVLEETDASLDGWSLPSDPEEAATVRSLIQQLASEDSSSRKDAAFELWSWGEPYHTQVTNVLMQLASSPAIDPQERRRTAEHMAKLSAAHKGFAAKVLRALAVDKTIEGVCRRWAAEGLRELGGSFAEEAAQLLRPMCSVPLEFGLTSGAAAKLIASLDNTAEVNESFPVTGRRSL